MPDKFYVLYTTKTDLLEDKFVTINSLTSTVVSSSELAKTAVKIALLLSNGAAVVMSKASWNSIPVSEPPPSLAQPVTAETVATSVESF